MTILTFTFTEQEAIALRLAIYRLERHEANKTLELRSAESKLVSKLDAASLAKQVPGGRKWK
jgi:hypothetical protein